MLFKLAKVIDFQIRSSGRSSAKRRGNRSFAWLLPSAKCVRSFPKRKGLVDAKSLQSLHLCCWAEVSGYPILRPHQNSFLRDTFSSPGTDRPVVGGYRSQTETILYLKQVGRQGFYIQCLPSVKTNNWLIIANSVLSKWAWWNCWPTHIPRKNNSYHDLAIVGKLLTPWPLKKSKHSS